MTAEQILKLIEGMENEERWKLLNLIYDEYFNKGNIPEVELDLK
jgi:hypothetical protein